MKFARFVAFLRFTEKSEATVLLIVRGVYPVEYPTGNSVAKVISVIVNVPSPSAIIYCKSLWPETKLIVRL